jgi:hypothetical protein
VGSTQLAVPLVQLQPKYESFWTVTLFFFGIRRSKNLRNALASPGNSLHNQSKPRVRFPDNPFRPSKDRQTSDVTQEPSGISGEDDQEPSAN